MVKNVGGFDRLWRFAMGIAFFLMGLLTPMPMDLKAIIFVVGGLMFVTGLFSI